MKTWLVFWVATCSIICAKSQNLIRNPSFETLAVECVNHISNFDLAVSNWSTPTLGTSDIFNDCSKSKVGVPFNFKGMQEAFDGNKYAGCFLYAPKKFREYIQTEIAKPLLKGKRYSLSFYISLSGDSQFYLNKIGMALTSSSLDLELETILTQEVMNNNTDEYDLYSSKSQPLKDKKGWTKIDIEFVAKGFEKYLILGNFEDGKNSSLKRVSKSRTKHVSAYYYIDNVSLTSLEVEKKLEKQLIKEVSFKKDSVYLFKNVNFKHNRITINFKAEDELKNVIDYLKNFDELGLKVIGHTDSSGTGDYNLELSRNRAKSIADYLISNGISSDRVVIEGKGETQPIDSTETVGRNHTNRRVEFTFFKRN